MATESSFVQPAVPKFDGHYDHWAMLMENFLRSKEYWIIVEKEVPAAAEDSVLSDAEKKNIEDLKLKDLKAKNYLFQALDRSILETILNKDTSKSIWDSMKQKFQGATRVKNSHLQALRKEFEILAMKSGESVNEYFARTLTIVNKMKANGEKKTDAEVVSKILRSLTTKFNYVVCAIEEAKDTSILTIDELQSSLLVHEQRMNVNSLAEEAQALKVSSGEQSGARGRGRGSYRGRGRGRGRQSFDKATVECYKCHKLGHFQWECSSKEANYVETQEEMLLMAFLDAKDDDKEDTWFLDSGCSNHMCGKKEYFTDFDESFADTVKLGNNTSLAVIGKGNVRLQVDGMVQIITGVFYVPELKNNLLSIGQLQEKGLAILFQHDRCKVYHSEKGLIMDTKMAANRMFKLHAVTAPPACFSTVTESKVQLWHCRYGHLRYNGLKTLQQKNMVNGLPELKSSSEICKDCMVGKQQRMSFPKKSTWRATQILQLIHADICGPITPASNSGKRYLITFIDDFSRKVWVYFLLEKAEAFVTFKRFKVHVEKESDLAIKCLRTDRGGEFTSHEFTKFCDDNGIQRQLTAAQRGWTIYQLDVKSAFLHGELSENVFVEQPSGYIQQGNEGKVYKLKKALYGLKQAPRAWYSRIDAYFSKEGFEKCDYEHTLFIKRQGDKVVIVSLYVDDLIVCGNDELLLIAFRNSMKNEFDMTDLGRMRYFLGLEVLQRSDGIFINQNNYASEVLKRFGMDNCNSVHNPIVPGLKPTKDEGGVAVDKTYYKQIIGSLMYLTATRPDMMFVVGLASRYMENPTQLHLQVVKRVLRYLKGTTEFGIFYKKGGGDELVAYTDSDYAADTEDRKSTSGYVFLLGSGAISWSSKKQPVVSLSTTEAEFIAASSCACQAVWLRRVLSRLDQSHDKLITIFCDNSSAIKLSKNPVMHGRSKHIDVRFHFLRELTKGGNVELVHCDSQDQVADVMTKPLKVDQFCKLRKLMGVCTEADIN